MNICVGPPNTCIALKEFNLLAPNTLFSSNFIYYPLTNWFEATTLGWIKACVKKNSFFAQVPPPPPPNYFGLKFLGPPPKIIGGCYYETVHPPHWERPPWKWKFSDLPLTGQNLPKNEKFLASPNFSNSSDLYKICSFLQILQCHIWTAYNSVINQVIKNYGAGRLPY